MSTQDSKFFNIFSLVLGILIVITILLFALARVAKGAAEAGVVVLDVAELPLARGGSEPGDEKDGV